MRSICFIVVPSRSIFGLTIKLYHKYIKDTAKKQAKSGVAVIEDAVVFKWAKEYFMKSNKELGIKETRLDRGKHGDVSKVETKENEDNFGSIFDIDDNNENTSDNSKKEDIEQISLFAA